MLTVTGSPATGYPTSLTITSDKRIHPSVPAVTESLTITIETAGETKVYNANREITPFKPAYNDPITITDSRGVVWAKLTDNGTTAVYVPA